MINNENYELMKYFLDMIKDIAFSNPEYEITEKFVYSQLIGFNVRKEQLPFQNIRDEYFENWIYRYKNNNGIDVNYHNQSNYFLWFINGQIKGNEIKLYIPMDKAHIKEGANQLFDFISSTNIEHQSKIASVIRNDNVVLRVNSLEDAKTIIDFVNSNQYIKEGMIKVNPFLPNYNGVGMAMDNSYSFNSTISKIISEFVTKLRNNNNLHLVTVENLNSFIAQQSTQITEPDLKDIYSLLEKTTSKSFQFQEFLNHANNKLIDKYQNRKRITDPKYYFEQALIETQKQHLDFDLKEAIKKYLHGENIVFTRNNRARDGVCKYVKPGDVINIMRQKLNEKNIQIPHTDNELITKYLDLILPKVDLFQMIQNAYINTLNAYDERQAITALKSLILNNDIQYFTNKFNDRKILKQNVLGHDVKKIILKNIDLDNMDINDINEILSRFIQITIQNKNKEKEY